MTLRTQAAWSGGEGEAFGRSAFRLKKQDFPQAYTQHDDIDSTYSIFVRHQIITTKYAFLRNIPQNMRINTTEANPAIKIRLAIIIPAI
jgi:hypothetical protein